jgi:pimeloyl-ACP methyl ester carboxylesterase
MTRTPPEPLFFATPDGISHAWYELGGGDAGPPIIMQHGFSATTWHEWVECGISDKIATLGRRVIGLDARGHGQSTRSHDVNHYGEGRMARDVSALVDHLGVPSFDYLGYSMGAIIGLEVGINEQQRLRRLVIAGIGEGAVILGGVDTRVLDRKVLAEGLRADDPSNYPPLVRAFRGGIEAMGNDRFALAAHAESYRHGGVTGLDRIKAPTLLIAGDADPLAIRPEVLAAAIPSCKLVIVPGDHVQARLVPDFAAAAMAFLR